MRLTTPSQPRPAARPLLLAGLLTALLLSLLMPAGAAYAAPILRLRLELAPGTPSPIPAGQPFRVRLTYECSSSIGTDQCLDMQVQSSLPAGVEGLQVIGNNDVTLASYDPATRTASWSFRSPLPLGTTGQLEFEVRYLPGTTLDGTTGVITATSGGPGATPGSGGITLPPADATPQPSVSKTLVAGGASDDISAYSVNVCAGASGALSLTNTTIVDTLPPGAAYVGSNPAGSYDALARTLTWGPLTVDAPGCRSFQVAVSYPAADPLNGIGALKTNVAGVTTTPFGGTTQVLTATFGHSLSGPNPQLNLRKTAAGAEGTADTIIGGVVTTTLTVDNIGTSPDPLLQGNVTISNVQIVDPIPAEQDVFAIDTGAATAVEYQRNGVDDWIGGVALGGNVAVDAASFPGLAPGDYISSLRFRFAPLTLLEGERAQTVRVLSTIVNPPNGGGAAYSVTAASPRMVPNTATASAEYKGAPLSDKSSTATIEVAVPKARPDPQKLITAGSPALPEGVVSYELRMRNGAFAPLDEPVVADLLPAAVSYNPGSWALAKNIPGCASGPAFSQTDDFNGSGRTLLLWSWAGSGCSIPGDEDARISFSVTVAEGTRAGTLPNRLALVDYSTDPALVRTGLCAGGAIPEAGILSAGGVGRPARYCFSDPSGLTVRAIASIGSAKFVRGQLDTSFSRDPVVGATVQGGLITYQIELENTGNIDLTGLEIVDILPYSSPAPGNVGVRDQVALGTAWTVQLAGPVVIDPPIPGLVIRYSSEVNPCRPTLTDGPNPSCTPMADGVNPGPGVWSTQLPSDPTAVRSLKFDFGGYTLLPVETIRFTFPAFAPVDAPLAGPGGDGSLGNSDDSNVAWNTFAYEATRADDGSALVAQPPRVGIEVQAPPASLASYGNYVWHDVNQNGAQDEPAFRGLNGVTVSLYRDADGNPATSGDQTLAGTQITRDDVGGDPGFYLFNALQPGFYLAEFERPEGYTITPRDTTADTLDSDIDGVTLRTAITQLVAGENDLTWDAGFYADSVSLGSRVWYDTNNDGLDNDGPGGAPGSSAGVPGVTVQLFLDEDGNGFLTGNEQSWVAQTSTDGTGFYRFTEQTRDRAGNTLATPAPLFPAQYLVGIPAASLGGAGPLAGYHSSGTTMGAAGALAELAAPDPDTGPDGLAGGGDDDRDYDDNGAAVRVIAGDPVPHPFAFYAGGVLSKPVFVDSGEPTGEPGGPGSAPGGAPIADGNSNLTVDFGFYTASVGDLVWDDDGSGGGARADGLRNGGEAGLAGVTVRLLSSSGAEIPVGPDGLLGTGDDGPGGVLTGAGGAYSFGRLPAGQYRVRAGLPAGYASTRDTAGSADPDSNVDDDDNGPATPTGAGSVTSAALSLTPGAAGAQGRNTITASAGSTHDPTVDFGMLRYYSLGNRVWDDRNNNGLQDPGEGGIAGVSLRLLQADGSSPALQIDGAAAPSQTSDAGGFYRFDMLPAGDYMVEVLAGELAAGGDLAGYRSSTADAPASGPYEPAPDPDTTAADADDNGTLGGGAVRSQVVTLGEGGGAAEPAGEAGGGPAAAAEAPDDQSNRTLDFGFWPTFTIGNRVWDDLDNSGTLNAADGASPGMGGLTVRLYRDSDDDGAPDGAAIATTTTSADGHYLFADLIAGTYIVEVQPPAGYRGSTGNLSAHEPGPDPDASGADDDDNGSDGAGVVRSAPITLSPGGEPTGEPATPGLSDGARDDNANYTVDFGLFLPLSLGNRVWEDTNNSGLLDAGEAGIPGVAVRLYRDSDGNGTPDGAAIATTATSGSGHYLFVDLGADTYIVEAVNPAGMVSSSGQSLPAPYEPAPDPDTLASEDDDNGTRGAGVARSAPVSLTRGGEPTDDEASTPGIADSTPDDRANYTVDFGFYTTLSLGNRVWNDVNNSGLLDGGEAGINGVTMRLYRDGDDNGSPDDLTGNGSVSTADAIASVDTAGGGYYLFPNLSAGTYIVEVDSAELSGGGTLASYTSSTGLTIALPYEPAPDPDADADSDDSGTLGAVTVRSAPVTLSLGGEPTGEPATPGFTDPAPADSNRNYTVDFGFYRRLSLGNRVWEDADNNGSVNGAEAGIGGLTVRLYRDGNNDGTPDEADGAPGITSADAIRVQTTSGTGYYLFTGLNQSTYIVEVVPPAGYRSSTGNFSAYEPAPDADTAAADSDDNGTAGGAVVRSAPVTLTDGGEPTGEPATPGLSDSASDSRANYTVDFGLFLPLSLGNLVWEDADNSGLRDGGEAGIPGVTVRLYRDSDGNGSPDDLAAPAGVTPADAIRAQSTNGSGHYLFAELGAGSYIVEAVNPAGMASSGGQTLPTPYEPAPDPDALAADDDDNGTRGAGVARSAPVTLSVGGEPTGEPATPGLSDSTPDGSANYTVDFGFYTLLSLGNRVWEDADNSGLRDGGEVGIDGVTVRLYRDNDADGSPDDLDGGGASPADAIASASTAGGGYYLFTGLSAGTYLVEIVPPAGYRSSVGAAVAPGPYEPAPDPDTVAADDDDNGGAAGAVIRSAPISLSVGGEPSGEPATPGLPDAAADANANYALDFGLYSRVALGDLIFVDANNNGAFDGGDSPLPGATVALLEGDGSTPAGDGDGSPVAAQTSGADGRYLFGNLSPGDYVVRVTPPDGYRSSGDIATSADPNNNANGDDNGVGGDVAGAVLSGVITLTSGGEPTDDGDSSSSTNLSADFGFYRPVSLGDLAFHDVANDGVYDPAADTALAGVAVELLQSDGATPATDVAGDPVPAQATGADGRYSFTNLRPGGYVVRAAPPAGYYSSDDIVTSAGPNNNTNGDDNGVGDSVAGPVASGVITLTSGGEPTDDGDADGDSNLSVDFGFYQAVSLGDLVFFDRDNSGLLDGDDAPLAGATVALLAPDGATPAVDLAGDPVPPQTTGADGLYRFADLAPGQYVVRATPPAGYRSSDDRPTGANPDTDVNADDNGVGGSVTGPVASGLVTLTSGGEPTDDGDGDPSSNLSVDFGFYQTVSLGDLVFADVANDGVYDPAADSPIGGAALALLLADGATPARDADGAPVAGQTSGADGRYGFSNLKPGRYVVRADVGGVSPEYRSSADIAGGDTPDNNRDGDDNGAGSGSAALSAPISLSAGAEPTDDGDGDSSSNLSLDFGFFLPASLGDLVWLDRDRDGAQGGDEPGVPGVTVRLYRPGADGTPGTSDDALVGSTTTDGEGLYSFTGLGAGDYFVAFSLPAGYARSPLLGSADPGLDSDADPATGRTPVISLGVDEHDMSWDAGISYTASLGDRVWLDRDADGIQGADEAGVPGVAVGLYEADGTPAGSTATDEEGFYAFSNLPPGDYYLIFTPPAGYELSPRSPAGAPDADSDADPDTGRTATTRIDLGEHDPSWDAGIYQRVRLGNLVWEDADNDGLVGGGEAGIPGVSVRLYRDADGDGAPDSAAPLATTSTDSGGRYQFELAPGGYIVEAAVPAGYATSTGVNGAPGGPFEAAPDPDDDRDGDDNGSRAGALLARSATVTLWSQGEPEAAADGDDASGNLSVDFGLFRPASLGSVVWYDGDADGQHQGGDQGVSGVTITLYTGDGEPVLDGAGQPISVVTGDDGYFLFENLVPGSYRVHFGTLPSGYTFTLRDEGDDGSDSDAEHATGLSQVVTLGPGQSDLTIYAGLLPPTAIQLLAFSAEADGAGAVLLRWSTGIELGSAGFHLYRSADGSRAGAVRVTKGLIPARGGPLGGADYSWLDRGAEPGRVYSYWLQEVEHGGRTSEHGPVTTGARPAEATRLYLPLLVR